MKKFKDLNLHPSILKAVEEAGYQNPTPIQEQGIPAILNGEDLLASAQTGTGKTAAFILPALHILANPTDERYQGPRILILVPTRELAMQVATEAAKYSKHLPRINTVCIYGGVPYPVQNRQLSRPYEILVATPGRLIDHVERGRVDLSQVEMLILDEADRMLDMGFIEPVEYITAATPDTRQTLLFSATLKGSVLSLSKRLLKNPTKLSVAHDHEKHENIEQRLYYVDDVNHKHRILNHILRDPEINQAIVFTSTKKFADHLVDELSDAGCDAAALHGDMDQRQRTRTIKRLREGHVRFLIATDVAARGIDVQTISHVINFDLPMSAEDYVHRIGRTGRAGATGIALSFAANNDRHLVNRIEEFTGQKITPHVIPGMEPTMKPRSSKPFGSRGNGPRSGGPRGGGSRGDRSRSSAPRNSAPRDDQPRDDSPRSYAPRNSAPRDDQPRGDFPRGDRPRSSAPRSYAPRSSGPRDDQPRGDFPKGDRPRSSGPRGDSPRGDFPRGDRPRSSAPRGDGPRGDFPKGDRPRSSAPRGDGPRSYAPRSNTPRSEGARESAGGSSQRRPYGRSR